MVELYTQTQTGMETEVGDGRAVHTDTALGIEREVDE